MWRVNYQVGIFYSPIKPAFFTSYETLTSKIFSEITLNFLTLRNIIAIILKLASTVYLEYELLHN